MNQENKAIAEFLKYYFNLEVAPEYAVMLKGNWGSGKTCFIEKILHEFTEKSGKALHVSLYGITSVLQIEQEFFRQLHPILGSKGGALAGKLIKGLLKGTIKLDLDNDGKDDGTASIGVPDINLPDYLKDTKNFVLVFDDLERCSLPINEVLGYINYFVERDGYKVVILANESEFLKKENASRISDFEFKYSIIKEKLIGKTFQITPEIDDALTSFFDQTDSLEKKSTLEKNREKIKQLYKDSEYNNLRHLRQAILDFSRIFDLLNIDNRRSDQLLSHLLTFFLIYSFEIKSAKISPSDIGKIDSLVVSELLSKNDAEKHYFKFTKKYSNIDVLDNLLPGELWEDMFSTGLFNASAINIALQNSKYFVSQDKPDWVRLWHAYDLPDSEVSELLISVWENFATMKYNSLSILRHIVGSLLELSKQEVCKYSKEEILEVANANLQNMQSNGALEQEFSSHEDMLSDTGFGGLGYQSRDSKEFMDFVNQIETMGKEAIRAGYPKKSKALLLLMKNDIEKFCACLIMTNGNAESRYYDVPILAYIPAKDFVNTLESFSGNQFRILRNMFAERYIVKYFLDQLLPELPWLSEVLVMVCEAQQERKGKMSGAHLSHLINTLETAIFILQSLKDKQL